MDKGRWEGIADPYREIRAEGTHGVRLWIFSSIRGSEVGQTRVGVSSELARCRRLSVADGGNVLYSWKAKSAGDIRAKESTYGSAWTVSFAKNSEWATVAGVSGAPREDISAEGHLFSLGRQLLRTSRTHTGARKRRSLAYVSPTACACLGRMNTS